MRATSGSSRRTSRSFESTSRRETSSSGVEYTDAPSGSNGGYGLPGTGSAGSASRRPQNVISSTIDLRREERAHALAAVDAPDRLAEEGRDGEDRDRGRRLAFGGSGIVSVTITSAIECLDALERRAGEDAVGGAGVDLVAPSRLQRPDRLDQRAGGVDLVVDDDRASCPPPRR